MKKMVCRPASWRILLHWGVAFGLLAVAASIYVYVFWLPFRGVDLTKCPAACTESSDCWVPGCSRKTECHKGKCQLASGHKVFLSASVMGFLIIFGLLWCVAAYHKMTMFLEVDSEGIRYKRFMKELHIPWDAFLGVTYHGVNTRFGREATVYSFTGDTGLFSFIVPGLPSGTMTRELELGAFFFLHLTSEQLEELLALVKEQANAEPEAEHEW